MFNKLYKWHHRVGLLVMIPVLGWCISGLTHPMMAHFFKIEPAQRFLHYKAATLDSTSVALETFFKEEQIASFTNFRLVNYKDKTYYQIIQKGKETIYVDIKTGERLENGDALYAEYLARYFLGDETSRIVSIEPMHQFTFEYKFINRLLPVYKVSFDRADKMDVYVETNSSRLGTMNNSTRKTCIAIFSYLHNWNFLAEWPTLKLWLLLIFMALAFWVAASGVIIYGFLWKSFQKNKGNKQAKGRKWHRRVGLAVSISTLAFAFSGGYHALAKKGASKAKTISTTFTPEEIVQLPKLINNLGNRLVKNISIVAIEGKSFFQVHWLERNTEASYFNTESLSQLGKGEERYAIHLASQYAELPADKILSIEPVLKFGGEYGFINKRLPVTKVQYDTDEQHTIYVETSSGKLAANISAPKRLEAFSFLMLHKYHFLDPLGKKVRDAVIVCLILGIMAVNILGLILWLKF